MNTSRQDIRSKALRAAAKVALLGAGYGCGAAGTQGLEPINTDTPLDVKSPRTEPLDGGSMIDAGLVLITDAGIVPDAGTLTIDAGMPNIDAGMPNIDAGMPPMDAGLDCDQATQSQEDYLACCEANGWDWNRGCAAWGPPCPPAFVAKELV